MTDVTSAGTRTANVQTLRTNFAAASPPTNSALVTVSAGTIIVCVGAAVATDEKNSTPVAVRIGFGATTTPTGAGVVFAHPNIRHGDYISDNAGAGGMLGDGADGEDLRITGADPLNGSYDVVVRYYTRAV